MRSKRNRNIAIGVVAAAAVAVAIYLVAAPDAPTPYADDGSGAQPEGSGGERRVRAFGQTVRMRTYLTTIEVRPTGFERLGASETAGPGVAVDVTIRNVGREPYRDQPMQAASVTLGREDEAERTYEPRPGCEEVPDDTVRIPPGAVRRYCLPFEATERPDLFVYAAESGLPTSRGAPEAGAWAFGG